jgi:hypothetical protein
VLWLIGPAVAELGSSGYFAHMTSDIFWKIIDDARSASGRLVEMPARLVDTLAQMDEQEIVEFAEHFTSALFLSYDAKLWLGAVVILGGCGDDKFADFRGWLIAQGRVAFESALAEPDSMAGLDSFDGDYGLPILFKMNSVARRAFCKRQSGDMDNFDAAMRFEQLFPVWTHPSLRNQELANTSDDDARTLLPKLAARFPKKSHTS